mmetsp:Transcript_104319/g.156220  ORF Transcript_104319/g.156220 Transcript_104319/m.156220 type:complete len:84 (+) Transcript_104319:371-622(+)
MVVTQSVALNPQGFFVHLDSQLVFAHLEMNRGNIVPQDRDIPMVFAQKLGSYPQAFYETILRQVENILLEEHQPNRVQSRSYF